MLGWNLLNISQQHYWVIAYVVKPADTVCYILGTPIQWAQNTVSVFAHVYVPYVLKFVCQGPPFLCEYFNMNEGIKFEIRETVHRETQRLLQAGNKAQLHWEISTFSRDLCTSRQCCFASTVVSILAVTALLRPYWCWMVKVHHQTAQYYMTRLLPCKHKISLFGCPCHSHALLKPCELQILLFSVGLLTWVCCSWLTQPTNHIGWFFKMLLLLAYRLAMPLAPLW